MKNEALLTVYLIFVDKYSHHNATILILTSVLSLVMDPKVHQIYFIAGISQGTERC